MADSWSGLPDNNESVLDNLSLQCVYQPAHFPSLVARIKFPLPTIHTRIPLSRQHRELTETQATVTAPIQYSASVSSSIITQSNVPHTQKITTVFTVFAANTDRCDAARCRLVGVQDWSTSASALITYCCVFCRLLSDWMSALFVSSPARHRVVSCLSAKD